MGKSRLAAAGLVLLQLLKWLARFCSQDQSVCLSVCHSLSQVDIFPHIHIILGIHALVYFCIAFRAAARFTHVVHVLYLDTLSTFHMTSSSVVESAAEAAAHIQSGRQLSNCKGKSAAAAATFAWCFFFFFFFYCCSVPLKRSLNQPASWVKCHGSLCLFLPPTIMYCTYRERTEHWREARWIAMMSCYGFGFGLLPRKKHKQKVSSEMNSNAR